MPWWDNRSKRSETSGLCCECDEFFDYEDGGGSTCDICQCELCAECNTIECYQCSDYICEECVASCDSCNEDGDGPILCSNVLSSRTPEDLHQKVSCLVLKGCLHRRISILKPKSLSCRVLGAIWLRCSSGFRHSKKNSRPLERKRPKHSPSWQERTRKKRELKNGLL